MLYDQLWDYQTKAYDFAMDAPGNHAALFYEQGTGKTYIASAIVEELSVTRYHTGNQFSGLIVAPLSTIQADDGWRYVLGLTNLGVFTDYTEFKKCKSPKILLLNWEALGTRRKKANRPKPKSRRLADFLVKHKWDFVCFDESQKMKARNSKQSRLASRIKYADYRLILSGTPFDNLLDDPQEIWAQWRFLSPDLFGRKWSDFDQRFLAKTGWMGKKRKFRSNKAKDKVLLSVKANTLRVTKEVLNLEKPEYIWCPVSMLGQQRRLYDSMETHSVVTVHGEPIVAELEITKVVRLQQICGGFIKDEDGETHDVGRAKLRKLKSLVKKTDFPIVIFAKYIFEVEQIAQELSSGIVTIDTIIGKTRRTRGETISNFQNGKTDILIAQVKTGGVGINLQVAHNAIFYSTTFSYIDFDQAVSRLHRAGQKKKVKIFLLFCRSSIDRRIFEVILSKRNVSEQVLDLYRISQTQPLRRPLMAKKKSDKADKSEAPAKEKKAKAEAKKFSITELSEEMGIEPASVRVQLRKHKVEKSGGRYGWDTKAEMLEVVKQIKVSAKAKAKSKAADDEDEDDDDED